MAVADRYLLDRIVVNQPQYNLLNRRIEHEIIPVSKKYGIGQVVFSPLAQGVLTGKYKGGRTSQVAERLMRRSTSLCKGSSTPKCWLELMHWRR